MTDYHDDYTRIIKALHEKGELTNAMKTHLISKAPVTLDEMEQCLHELFDAIAKKDYYLLLERMEKGEKLLEAETDPDKRAKYRNVLKAMAFELERIAEKLPKGA